MWGLSLIFSLYVTEEGYNNLLDYCGKPGDSNLVIVLKQK